MDTEKEIRNNQYKRKCKLEQEAFGKMQDNPKYFYSYTKKLRGKTSKIGTLVDDKNIPINKPCQEILQDQYKDMWIEPKEQFLISDPISFWYKRIHTLCCLLHTIFEYLKHNISFCFSNGS